MNNNDNNKDYYITELTQQLTRQSEQFAHSQTKQQALLAISELGASAEDLDKFYRSLHNIIADAFYAENFYIALKGTSLDQTSQANLELVYFVDKLDEKHNDVNSARRITLATNGLSSYLFSLTNAILLTAEDIIDLTKNNNIQVFGPLAHSWLGAPLITNGETLGIIVVQSYSEDFIYQQWHKELFNFIANTIANALERKQSRLLLETQIKEKTQTEKLTKALYEISKLASGVEDMPAFYTNIHKILGNLFYAENFYIALYDKSDDQLVFDYFSDLEDDRPMLGERYSINNRSISSFLFRSDKSLLIHQNDFAQLAKAENIVDYGVSFVSWLGVPLRENNHSIGIMVVQSYLQNIVYEPWHQELLEYVSHQVAMTLNSKKYRTSLEKNVLDRTRTLEIEIESRIKSQETQSALYFIANLANMELALDEFYRELHNIIGRLVYCENFFIGLKNEDEQSVSIVYYVDTKDNYDVESISAIPFDKLKKSLSVYVMNSGRSLLATAEEIKALTLKENLDVFGEETVSWLGIPLTINGAVIGILVLQSYLESQILTEKDRELMIFVSQHVATALQRNKNNHYLKYLVEQRTNELNLSNKQLKKQIIETERSKRLQVALYQIADLASSKESVDFLYQQFHHIISQLIYANNFFIALYDDIQEELEFVYFVDTKDKLNKDILKTIPKSDLKNTYTGYVLRTGESYLKTIHNKNEQKKMGIVTIGKDACYWLGVPLKIDESIIGIIVIQSYDEDIIINEWQKELLEFVSHHIAITLERKNASKALEKRVEQRTSELAKTNKDLLKQIIERKRSEAIQAALYKIANLSNRDIPLNKLFQKSHQIISPLIYAENFFIALWDKDNDDMDWSYFADSQQHAYLEPIKEFSKDYKKKTFARYIVKTGQPLLVNKTMMTEMANNGDVNIIGPLAESLLGVPLIGVNGPIGSMAVQSYSKDIEYTLADQELLNFVGQSISTTIEKREYNLRLEKIVEKRTEQLTISNDSLHREILQRKESEELQTALFNISETPQLCNTQEELYLKLHEIISRLMYLESFYIALVDLENNCFKLDFVYDHVDENIPVNIPMDNTLTGYVYRQGKTVHLNPENISQLVKRGEINHFGAFSVDWVGVPLISGGLIYGIMILQSYDPKHVYGDRELGIINFVSTHIAEALQRKNAEKKLELAYAELANKTQKAEAASKAKSTFLATVSHEIRTPMNGILGLLSLISDTEMNRLQRDYIAKISSSAKSLLGIINDILDFSKIEQGKLELEHINFNLLEVLDNLVDLFSSRINEKQLNFNINIEPSVFLQRIGDALRLSQILINLVGNAIKFTQQGFISVHIFEEDSYLIFSIEDSGIGIDSIQRSKIFESFTQADDTTTRRFGGSGLGLSICKQLISMMSGEINVEGELGIGSLFIFKVKIDKQSEPVQKIDTSGVHLLLISDDARQVNGWGNFCRIFNIELKNMTASDLLKLQLKSELLPEYYSHIFIDDSAKDIPIIDLLEIVQYSMNVTTPCFLLAQPTPQIMELTFQAKDTQLISKPNKMGIILNLIQNDYDILQIEPSKTILKHTLRKKLLNANILLAEDNIINQQVAKEILLKAGAKVTIVENGILAIQACKEAYYDLVLMDMQMPIMDGYQASTLIREIYSMKELPIIAMTANVMKGDKEKCLSFGMNNYIGKPIDRRHFLETIELYVDKSTEINDLQHTDETNARERINIQNQFITLDPFYTQDHFNIQDLADKFDSQELASELVTLFYATHKSDKDLIQNLLKVNQLDDAKRVFHKLKGSSGELGLNKLHKLAAKIENLLKQEVLPSAEIVTEFLINLENILSQFNQLIKGSK